MSHKFEELFSKYTGSKFATTVSSCTAGMHLYYIAKILNLVMRFQRMRHISTAHSISLTGAKPIFVDCNSLNGTIDDKIEKNHKKN